MKFAFDATRFGSGLDGAVDLAAAGGFSAVEFSFAPFVPAKKSQDAKEKKYFESVYDLALKKNVEFACLNLDFTLDCADKKSLKQFLPMITKLSAVARTIGCGKVSFFLKAGSDDDWMQTFAGEYPALSEQLMANDVRPLVRLATPTDCCGVSLKKWRAMEPQEWRDLITACPGLSFVYSPADLIWLGIDYLLNLPAMVSAIEHVVAHDIEINRSILTDSGLYGPLWWRYRLAGKGQVDWRQFIEALKLYDYQGTFSLQLEDEFLGDDPHALNDALAEGKKYFAPLLRG
ncbi:MAG: sugar phosphate isomerase/epimerase [Cyanobacteria bacterium SZAS LIN-3]|nr:sugar phosphate isomerase/epimerase [Cyanobacteria bacterium SZAS LIN-3]